MYLLLSFLKQLSSPMVSKHHRHRYITKYILVKFAFKTSRDYFQLASDSINSDSHRKLC